MLAVGHPSSGPAERAGVSSPFTRHRGGVGVSEVVQAEVVRDREATDERPGVMRVQVLRSPADHDRDLAFVVEEATPRRPYDLAVVRVQGRDRLVEVRRSIAERHLELRSAALVVQMDADDLRRLDRRGVQGCVNREGATVRRDQRVTVSRDRRR
jgi:hypothetical protein